MENEKWQWLELKLTDVICFRVAIYLANLPDLPVVYRIDSIIVYVKNYNSFLCLINIFKQLL